METNGFLRDVVMTVFTVVFLFGCGLTNCVWWAMPQDLKTFPSISVWVFSLVLCVCSAVSLKE